ncbi:unnamed protein product [Effrenium voratum]|uniref:Uncharacterized protein n=1 Tax=Effrenium voratum TaxID=2562239 RepID=A0AA36MMT9_9DINO|nr:unnamed protein product [Effrenium voratum]
MLGALLGFALLEAAMSQDLTCHGKNLGESCDVGLATTPGVCASVEVNGFSQMLCLACGPEGLDGSLGRLGTWGVFAVGVTCGSVATSGLLAVAWRLRRKFETPFEELGAKKGYQELRMQGHAPMPAPRAAEKTRDAKSDARGVRTRDLRPVPSVLGKTQVRRTRKPSLRTESRKEDRGPEASSWRRRLDGRSGGSQEIPRAGKWAQLELQLNQDLAEAEDGLSTWAPPASIGKLERSRGFTEPAPSRCLPKPSK